jgi:oligopeptide/dipeptide ABC transporter ATP-binding protein
MKILELENVTKIFTTSQGKELVACNNISLSLEKGKTLGIVGESGCGKSTLIRMIIQLEKVTSGRIKYNGQDISKFTKEEIWKNRQKIQMVFQDSLGAFNPKMKIIDIITEPLINFGLLDKKDKEAKAEELLKSVDLPLSCLYSYPHSVSGGQLQRVSIARALSLEPEILVCDEATSALDVSVQKNIMTLLDKLRKEKKLTVIFVCHDLALVQSFADDIVVMYLGNMLEYLSNKDIVNNSYHPYTKALLASVFSINDMDKKLELLEGEIPSPSNIPKGCPFVNRCKKAVEVCYKEQPILKKFDNNHYIKCHTHN